MSMSIEVGWGTPENTIIHMRFRRGWTWDDVRAAVQHVDDSLVATPHTVHLLLDIREAGGLPRDFSGVIGELLKQGEARSNEGRRVVVGANFMLRTVFASVQSLYGRQLKDRAFQFADTPEQAHKLLLGSNP